MKALAKFCLVVFGHVSLGVELLYTMREGAGFLEGTVTGELPVLAQLCLVFGSEIL